MHVNKSNLIKKAKHHLVGLDFYTDKFRKGVNLLPGGRLSDIEKDKALVDLRLMREEIQQIEQFVKGKL